MKREYHHWFSPALGREMELLIFGHAGVRVLIFPTSLGRFYHWEDRAGIAALADLVERGSIQIFCVDSVDAESWYDRDLHPAARARRQVEYDRYLQQEVLPLTSAANPNAFLITAGADFGAYHAVNFAFRHPDLVNRVIGLSGFYDIRRWSDGYTDDNVYFNNPVEFMANEQEPARLDALRHLDIVLAIGFGDPSRPNNEYLSSLLWEKGIWHALRIWDGSAHDWPSWQSMIRLYLDGSV